MNRLIFTTLIFIVFLTTARGQSTNDCNEPYNNYNDFQFLTANKVKATIPSRGGLFHGEEDNRFSQFLVPHEENGDIVSSIFAAGLWIGGYTPNGDLKVSISTYGWLGGYYDYCTGPLDSMGNTSAIGCEYYSKVWKVKGVNIQQFLADFEDNGQIDDPIPPSIQYWPARGNLHLAHPLDIELAPFFDRNRNGIYEPENGEYPVISKDFQKVIPTELIWCVFNTNGIHTESQSDPFPIEVQLTAWAFDCAENDLLNHTVFTRHKIINKSEEALERTHIGLWMDADLGCDLDDIFGCDTLKHTVYFYNSDNIDEASSDCYNSGHYGENPPVQSFTFLNQPMTSVAYYERAFEVFGGKSRPGTPIEYYNYSQGIWKDGAPIYADDDGYADTEAPITSFAFSGNPNDENGWSIYQEGIYDEYLSRDVIAATGGIVLAPNEPFALDIAYTFHREEGSNHLENVNYALERIPPLQRLYDEHFTAACIISKTEDVSEEQFDYNIFPNPTNGQIQLDLPFSLQHQKLQLAVYDLQGKVLLNMECFVTEKLTIDLPDDISSGLYFLKISTLSRAITTRFFKS